MIRIKKDNDILLCSNKTYESMYKRLGYTILEDKEKMKVKADELIKEAKNKNLIKPIEEAFKNEKDDEQKDVIKEKTVSKKNDKRTKNRTKNKKGE